jgi:putative RNA 2'-phosphotransferase
MNRFGRLFRGLSVFRENFGLRLTLIVQPIIDHICSVQLRTQCANRNFRLQHREPKEYEPPCRNRLTILESYPSSWNISWAADPMNSGCCRTIKVSSKSRRCCKPWREIRNGAIFGAAISKPCMSRNGPPPSKSKMTVVRACHRDHLPVPTAPATLPPLLYTAIRRRSYPVALDKGVRPAGAPHVLLSPDIALIERIGRRTDNDPIILTVQVAASKTAGTHYLQYGEALYLADFIAAGSFSGPPLPKEKPIAAQPSSAPKEPVKPGSFFPDLATIERKGAPQERPRRNEADWKKDRRRARKDKARQGY